MNRVFFRIMVVAVMLAAAASARATLIAWDGLEGATVGGLNGVATGQGWASNWFTGQTYVNVIQTNSGGATPTLTYARGGAQVATGTRAIQIGNGGTGPTDNVFNRTFANQTSTVYFSLLVKRQANGAGDTNTDFLQMALSQNADVNNSGSVGTAFGTTDPTMFGRIRNGTTDFNTDSNVTFTVGQTYLVVAKLSKSVPGAANNFNQLTYWINPDSTLEGENIGLSVATNSYATADLNTLVSRIARLEAGDQILVDELRIGTEFGDVVPEPGSASILLLAAGLLHRRRRHLA